MTGVQTCALPICFPVTIGDVVEGAMQSGKRFVWFDMVEDEMILKEAKQRAEEIKEQTV